MIKSAPTPTDDSDSVDFVDLYRSESAWLTRFFEARLRSADDAHDLAHETLMRFFSAAQRSQIDAPQFYLRKIAINLVRKHVAQGSTLISRNSTPFIEDMETPIGTDPHRDLEGRAELAHWDAVLGQLKPRTREIFLLSRIDGWNYKEIAAHYKMTVWGVKKHMMKAIAHIDRNRRAGW